MELRFAKWEVSLVGSAGAWEIGADESRMASRGRARIWLKRMLVRWPRAGRENSRRQTQMYENGGHK